MLLNRQKPMARSVSAWCPGGRVHTNAARAVPDTTASQAATAPPADSRAAFHDPVETAVSGSSCTGARSQARRILSMYSRVRSEERRVGKGDEHGRSTAV